jgi:hypothetical protein
MAQETISPVLITQRPFDSKSATVISSHRSSSLTKNPYDSSIINVPVDDVEIPTVDFTMLFSDDLDKRSRALEHINQVCKDFGAFYVC